MKQTSTTQNSQQAAQSQQSTKSGDQRNRKLLLYLVAALVVLAVIAVLILLFMPMQPQSSTLTTIMNHSANPTAVYMGSTQFQSLLGSTIANYNTSDMFNQYSPINITEIEAFVPSLQGNVTSAWQTSGYGSNSSENVSMEYFVFQTSNTPSIAEALFSVVTSSLNITPEVVTPGVQGGFNYTYGLYRNSTVSFQVLSGWKDGYASIIILQSFPNYLANQTRMIGIAANDTP